MYARTVYSGDAISYLNVVRAIHAGDWKLAFNPLWGIGYPLLLSVVTRVFPATPGWEWVAIHVLNLLIFLATLLSFWYLALTAARSARLRWIRENVAAERFLLVAAFLVFVGLNLTMDNVSRVGPDMLVSLIVYLAAGLLLRLREQASVGRAVGLGLILGFGCSVKNVFLPLMFLFLVVLVLTAKDRLGAVRTAVLTGLAALVFLIPNVAGLSHAMGHLTLGESGSINYAWHVNKLQDGAFWEGAPWPPSYGKPIHPPTMVMETPHVFLFAEPFPVTYPPFFNPPYFYEGYRHFFNAKLQASAILHNLYQLVKIFRTQVLVFAVLLCWLLAARRARNFYRGKPRSAERDAGLWMLGLIAVLGIGLYLLVWVEDRYIVSFAGMLLLLALFKAMEANRAPMTGRFEKSGILVWMLVIGCACTLLINSKEGYRDVLGNLRHQRLFHNDPQWVAAEYLRQQGLKSGDPVAVVSDLFNASRANWAYYDGLRIIGQLHGESGAFGTSDFDAFWRATPERQREILGVFQKAGAKVVFAPVRPDGVSDEGWVAVPGTAYWIYWLR